ncbi:cell wall hydrolase [Histidinibacterium lentulum]|uniref:Cell wall hydrolase n=1 Tax=Histidinibacterium lentulum TaxID=2480588 RepID=A0A3N2QSE1_9RHOB|nr:cell wall hydrolase [Histidinibacterium lentulum]ROT98128.1 cell wall hydrolase [Histidinibacterium lentulum]
MKTRLTDLLGAEHASLQEVAPARLEALTAERLSTRSPAAAGPAALYEESALAALPVASGSAQWRCLTEALYFEARGESLRGLFGVAEVILNRVDDPRYPDTICGVVNEGTGRIHACQFSYTCDGIPETVRDQASWHRVGKVARLMMDGAESDLTGGATHYHTRAVNPSWASRFPRTTTIGVHHFYRWPLRTASN